jgi:hypothetical protein
MIKIPFLTKVRGDFFDFECKINILISIKINYSFMAQILDETKQFVLVKFTKKEFKALTFNENKLEDYEFVFDPPIKASELLKTF